MGSEWPDHRAISAAFHSTSVATEGSQSAFQSGEGDDWNTFQLEAFEHNTQRADWVWTSLSDPPWHPVSPSRSDGIEHPNPSLDIYHDQGSNFDNTTSRPEQETTYYDSGSIVAPSWEQVATNQSLETTYSHTSEQVADNHGVQGLYAPTSEVFSVNTSALLLAGVGSSFPRPTDFPPLSNALHDLNIDHSGASQDIGPQIHSPGNFPAPPLLHSQPRPFDLPVRINPLDRHECGFCNNIFNCQRKLEHHVEEKHSLGSHICGLDGCKKFFRRKGDLKRHQQSVQRHLSDESQIFICRCKHTDPRRYNHKRHLESCNKPSRTTYQCGDCGRNDQSKDAHISHLKTQCVKAKKRGRKPKITN